MTEFTEDFLLIGKIGVGLERFMMAVKALYSLKRWLLYMGDYGYILDKVLYNRPITEAAHKLKTGY